MTTAVPWEDDLARVREAWPDARRLSDDRLRHLLAVATEQLAAYAPSLRVGPDGSPPTIPAAWREACVLQAREVASAATREGDVVGGEVYAVRARPLSATVKALLRPPGRPVVG